MLVRNRLRELHDLLSALLERPVPGVLVVSCTDHEVLYLVHALTQLDQGSPADRIVIVTDAFVSVDSYLSALETRLELNPAVHAPGVQSDDASSRLRACVTRLVSELPAGDHRLLCALLPARIDDPTGFATLAGSLIHTSMPPAARLVIREDRRHPQLYRDAENHPSHCVLAYSFFLPASLVVADVTATAHDPARPPEERAQALLQLAVRDLGHGRYPEALSACDTAARLSESPVIAALAHSFRADVLRASGDPQAAIHAATQALHGAVASRTLPIVHHVAMTLGDLTCALGRLDEAAACFDLAERAAPHSPDAQALARTRRTALRQEKPC